MAEKSFIGSRSRQGMAPARRSRPQAIACGRKGKKSWARFGIGARRFCLAWALWGDCAADRKLPLLPLLQMHSVCCRRCSLQLKRVPSVVPFLTAMPLLLTSGPEVPKAFLGEEYPDLRSCFLSGIYF